MRSLTKSPIAFMLGAYDAAKRNLPEYSREKSKHVFTLHQLFAVVALRIFFKLDYRGIEAIVRDFRDIRENLGLQKTPDYSTICRAQKKIMARFGDMLAGTIESAEALGMVTEADKTAAIDSTGYETGRTSDYYSQRTGLTKSHYPKMTTVCLTQSHFYIWAVADKGPLPDATSNSEKRSSMPTGRANSTVSWPTAATTAKKTTGSCAGCSAPSQSSRRCAAPTRANSPQAGAEERWR